MHTPHKLSSVPLDNGEGHAVPDRMLESARYALLQRLAPAIRHHIAGAFQPIMMLASSLERVAQMPQPDLPKMAKHGASVHSYARSGATAGLAAFSWASASGNPMVAINATITEAMSLLNTDLALREFSVANQTGDCVDEWPREALREVFTAALIAVTDVAPSPAEVVLSAHAEAEGTALFITVQSSGDTIHTREGCYRPLEWRDLELLAAANGVLVERSAGGVQLRLADD